MFASFPQRVDHHGAAFVAPWAKTLFVLLLICSGSARAQTITIGPNSYAFQYQPGATPTQVGLFFNSSQNRYEFRDLAGDREFSVNPIQQRSYFRGEVGLNITNPDAQLHVIGDARLGSASNYMSVDASGNLRFVGSAGYRVASNTYAFQANGSSAGLLFNVTENEYQFIDGGGDAVVAITATGGSSGSTRIEDDLRVAGNLDLGGSGGFARLAANSTGGSQRSAVRGQGFNDQTVGYLGVVGENGFDGSPLDIPSNEIGVLGISLGGTPSTDNIGVLGHADGIGMRASHLAGTRADMASALYALDATGDVRIAGTLSSDSSILDNLYLENNRDAVPGAVPPVLVGLSGANRLGLYKDAVQAENASGYSRLNLNPLGGDIFIGDGGGTINLADVGGGAVNIALGGGSVNVGDVWYTDPASGRVAIGDPTPDYTMAIVHPIGTGAGNGLAVTNALSATTWSLYSFIDGDLGLFEGDSLKGRFDNVSGNYTVISDRRLKSNIRAMEDATATLMDLRPVRYRFRSDASGERQYYGFVAQELQEVLPDLIHTESETGLLSVSYTELIPFLVAALQEAEQTREQAATKANRERQQLQQEVQRLETQLAQHAQRLERLEALLLAPEQTGSSGSTPASPATPASGSLGLIAPNPSFGQCTVSFTLAPTTRNAFLEAFDQQGRRVLHQALTASGQAQAVLNTTDWSVGSYRLRLLADGQVLDSAQLQVQR